MVEENISQEFRLKNIDQTKNYFLEEIKQNELMSKKHKKVFTTLNYSFLIIDSTIAGSFSISSYASLIGIPMGILISSKGFQNCAITVEIKKYKSIIKKKKTKHDKIVSLAKSKLNSIEVLISIALIDSIISHDEFVLIKNVQKEYDEMKEDIKNLKT